MPPLIFSHHPTWHHLLLSIVPVSVIRALRLAFTVTDVGHVTRQYENGHKLK